MEFVVSLKFKIESKLIKKQAKKNKKRKAEKVARTVLLLGFYVFFNLKTTRLLFANK